MTAPAAPEHLAPTVAPAVAAPPHRRLTRLAPAAAVAGLLLAAVGLVLGLRPLETPVQDCGTAFGFLLDGRLDVVADPAAPPDGLTAAQVEAANADRCQERAGNRSRPALALIVGGTLLGTAAALTEVTWRSVRRRRARRAWWAEHRIAPAPPPPPLPPPPPTR